MEKVVKKYKAKFVVDISDLGKDDPLMQNVRLFFSSKHLSCKATILLDYCKYVSLNMEERSFKNLNMMGLIINGGIFYVLQQNG